MKLYQAPIANFGRPYIIAELGSNHNGDMALARKLIDAAKRAGCDCVKFQSWSKDTIFARKVYDENRFLKDDYRSRSDHTLESIVEEFSISEQELVEMRDYCLKVGIDFASTPFAQRELDFLVGPLAADFVKVASMDLNNYPFLARIARTGRTVMISTGLSTLEEIDRAVRTIEEAGNRRIVILHCVSIYPPDDAQVNLRNMDMLRDNYPDYPVGFSDHTLGTLVPIAAIARGAAVIEKHFTLDKSMFGWDHKVSATEDEMAAIVEAARRMPAVLGSYRRSLSAADREKIPAFRRSVVAARAIAAGQVIAREDLDCKRPGTGYPPEAIEVIAGRPAKRDIPYDKVLDAQDF
jgi:N-acetylneuraminate synthase